MGVETKEPTMRFPAWRDDGEARAAVAIVDEAITSKMARDEAIGRAKEEALAKIAGSSAVSPDCEIIFINTVPYSGTEQLVTPVIRQPVDEHFLGLPA